MFVLAINSLSWQAWSAKEGCLHRGLAGYVITRFKRTSASRPGLYTRSIYNYTSQLCYKYSIYHTHILYSLGMFGDVLTWIQALRIAPLWRPSHENMATLKAILKAKLQAHPILPKSLELDITGSPKKNMPVFRPLAMCSLWSGSWS